MDVYFIRHGRTDGNAAWRHQHPDTPLNEAGQEHLREVLKLTERLRPTHLITSANLRAVETARLLAATTGLVPETNHDFDEMRRPASLHGHRLFGLATFLYIVRWFYGGAVLDGETYAEFRARLARARAQLEALPPEARVIVVSHSIFINFFVEHCCRARPLSLWRAPLCLLAILRHSHTAPTHLRHRPPIRSGACGWELILRA
jgi:broad specificity phosphatase PhoE